MEVSPPRFRRRPWTTGQNRRCGETGVSPQRRQPTAILRRDMELDPSHRIGLREILHPLLICLDDVKTTRRDDERAHSCSGGYNGILNLQEHERIILFGNGRGCFTEILEGLTHLQKIQVYEWMHEFKLSARELAAWRKDRGVFVKAVKYKIPIATPVDFICRDIYELKLFGVRVADFFHKNGQPSFLEICGRRFTREEAMRWVLIQSHLKKPFLFSKGEPQKILNSLAAETNPDRKRTLAETDKERVDKGPKSSATVSVAGGVRAEPQESGGQRSEASASKDEKPSQKELDRAAAEFARKNPSKSQSVSGPRVEARNPPLSRRIALSPADEAAQYGGLSRSNTAESFVTSSRLGRRAAPDDKQDFPSVPCASGADFASDRSLARSGKVRATTASKARIQVPILEPASVRLGSGSTTNSTTGNSSQGSSRIVAAPIEPAGQLSTKLRTPHLQPASSGGTVLGERPLNPIASPAVRPQSESLATTIQHPVKYFIPVVRGNVPNPTASPIYSITTNAAVQTFYTVSTPSLTQDTSSKAYQAMVEIYLRQFKVDVPVFSDWLVHTFGSNSVPQAEIFGRADLLLTTIENILCEFDKQPAPDASVIASKADSIGVPACSLQNWNSPEIRPLFHADKTALKYNLFQRVFTPIDDNKKSFLEDAAEIIRYRTRSDFATINLPHCSRKSSKYSVDLVKDVLDFFLLEPGVLDELPLGGNRKFRELLKKNPSIQAVQVLLHELGILISYRNELSMFGNLFSVRDAAFCFDMPLKSLPSPENMYHVCIEDAVKAVALQRRLRNGQQEEDKDVDLKKIRDLLEKY